MDDDSFDMFCDGVLFISFMITLICYAPFVCSVLHLLGLCHFQCFNNDVVWIYTALSAIAGALLQSALFKISYISSFYNKRMNYFVKKMILYHHKLKNPSRAKELNEVEE